MRHDKIRRFRPRTNKYRSRRNINGVKNGGVIHQVNVNRNGMSRNGVPKNPHSVERIIEKYKNLAKEALSSGDKILHENYLQHSDHFSRLLSEMEPKVKDNTTNQNESTEKTNTIKSTEKTNTINDQN